jgi:E3 ubiquitin-protein ligase RNF14
MWLDPQNPYQHFNAPGKPCYQRLWELEEGDNADGNVQFVGGVRGWEAEAIAAAAAEADADHELHAGQPMIPVAQEPVLVGMAQLDVQDIEQAGPDELPIDLDDDWPDFDEDEPDPRFLVHRPPAFERRVVGRPHQPRRPALGVGPIRRVPNAPGLRAGMARQREVEARAGRPVGPHGDLHDEHGDEWDSSEEELEHPVDEAGVEDERPAFVIREARRGGRGRGRDGGGPAIQNP